MGWQAVGLVLMGIASIGAAFKYTMGKKAYGYRGLGDLFVLVFFGYVGVLGVAFLLTHLPNDLVNSSYISGLMAVAVLNLNNLRDHDGDKANGKNTLVVKMGVEKAKLYHGAVLFTAWASLIWFLQDWKGMIWYALIALVCMKHALLVMRTENTKSLDPELKKVALIAFVTGLFMLMSVTI